VSLPVCFLSSSTVQCHFVTSLSTVNFNYNLHILYAYSTCYMQTVTGAIDTRKIHCKILGKQCGIMLEENVR